MAVEFLHHSLTCFLAAEAIYQQKAVLERLVWESPFGDEVNRFALALELLSPPPGNVRPLDIPTTPEDDSRQIVVGVPPRPPYNLIGRDSLLSDLKKRLFADNNLALSALNGLPGVGKTALAVELAYDHKVLEHFSDGVLWAGLGRKPDVLALLGTWGTALGIHSDEIAKRTSIEDRAKTIHAAIGTRRMLLVVDDAWQVETALAFQLGGTNCAHLVTTRLPEVALRFASEETAVHELSEADGLTLLVRLAPEVVEAEPDEARELVRAVGGLPLALILIGNYLRVQAHSGQPRRLRTALKRLREVEGRLQLAEPQAPMRVHPSLPEGAWVSLRAIIEISDEALDEASRSVLQALSVFPPKPNTFSEEAALTVCATPVETLDTLTDSGLLESSGPGRYTLHQTIADYARLKLTDEAAYERMVEFFVRYVETHETDYDALDLETGNVLAALQAAFDRGMQAALVRGANAIYHFLDTRGLYAQAEVHLSRAEQAARDLGDTVGLVTALLNLGTIAMKQGNYKQAEAVLREGLTLARNIAHRERIIALLNNLGAVELYLREFEQSEAYFQEGLTLAREINHHERIIALLNNLGAVELKRENLAQAESYFQESLALARQIGHRESIIDLYSSLGMLAFQRGDYEQAEAHFQQSLAQAREIGYRERISALLMSLGAVAVKRGDYAQAEVFYQESLDIAREIGHKELISKALANWGELAIESGNGTQAEAYLQEGLALAQESKETIDLILNLRRKLHPKQQPLDSASASGTTP